MNNLIMVTGPGRSGTSVITNFLTKLFKARTQNSVEIKKMKAGFESQLLIKTICMFGKKSLNPPHTDRLLHDNIDLGVAHLKKLEYEFDLVKSPLLYYYNNYEYFKTNLKRELIVIMTKRDKSENIIKSAKKINASDGAWKNNFLFYDSQYKLNIQKLQCLDIKYIEIEFPRFVTDKEYLKNKLKEYFNIEEKLFETLHSEIFKKDLVSF